MSKFKLLQEKYKKAQAEELKELNKKEKEIKKADTDTDDVDPFLEPPQIKQPSVAKAKKTIQLRNEWQVKVRKARLEKVTDKESKEKAFEPIIEELGKIVKVVKRTDEDLSNKLELMPAEVTTPPTPMKKLTYKLTTMIGTIPRLYLPFPDDKFGIWTDKKHHYIGNTPVVVDDNDLVIKNKRYPGTHSLWLLLTNPDKKSLDRDTFKAWWTNPDNFTEQDYDTYKESLNVTNAMYQNNNPLSDKPKSSGCKKWNDLVAPIWKEFKSAKSESG